MPSQDDPRPVDGLLPVIYEELHRLAAAQLRHERSDHTLQATAVVHEAYLRLLDQRNVSGLGRAAFMALAAQTIRRVLVDYARRFEASRRSDRAKRITLSDSVALVGDVPIDVLILDEALDELARVNPRHARMVELRFFSGLSNEEIASELAVSLSTIEKDWRFTRSWLAIRLASRNLG